MIEERTKERTRERIITPAQIRQVDTGEKREVSIMGVDGVKRTEERPILIDETVPPVKQTIKEKIIVFVIKDKVSGEEHEFTSIEDAERFIR